MIRIVALDKLDPGDVAFLTRTLYQAFGLGTEFAGDRPMPREAETRDGRVDAMRLLAEVQPVRTFADDKVLYITSAPLALKPGPLGEPPCWGFAEYGGEKAVITTARLPARGVSEASIEVFRRRLGREAIHAVGHLWDLHHCYDAKCAMHPSWSPALPADPEMDLDTFCREKSERRIRLAKT
ncbi:MAG TPA: archaemetzincin [Anaeromyxobacteraceae bacterium]|nr:archaemetzincin [Anaeromyxobacteraceae bacterium]